MENESVIGLETTEKLNPRKGLNAAGWRYAIVAVIILIVQLAVIVGAQLILERDTYNDNLVNVSFVSVIVSVDIFGVLSAILLCLKLPKSTIPKNKLKVGEFIMGILYCAGLCYGGSIVGSTIHTVISTLQGNANEPSGIAELMMNSGFFMRVLTVGILAPIFEELIFRKILIDHIAKYGKTLSIITSGLMFGLFHGNFQQCFFAAMIGMFFAYIYLRTGNILYTIAYHMIINCTTSIGTLYFTQNVLKLVSDGNYEEFVEKVMDNPAVAATPILMFLVWMGLLGTVAILGVIFFFINLRKLKRALPNDEGTPGVKESIKTIFSSWGMWLFFAYCVFLFVNSYFSIL